MAAAGKHYGARRTLEGLLRHTVADLLPDKTTWRTGTGWPSPQSLPQWRTNRRLSLSDCVSDATFPVRDLLDPRAVAALLARTDFAADRAIAYLVDLDAWLRLHPVAYSKS